MSMDPPVEAPGASFNFAQHLITCNLARSSRTAYVDDHGSLSFGALADRIRRMGAALLAGGMRREERVLLLMHDGCEWPVAFLGAIYAGIVPVVVNTLLTPEDYAYMLRHSRAQAVLVSGELLGTLRKAMASGEHEVRRVVVARPSTALALDAVALEPWLAQHEPLAAPATTGPDDPGFWLYASGANGQPSGTLHRQANPYWTAELYGKRVLGLTERDVCFSAARLSVAYGLGNALSFPLSVGATTILMAEHPTPEATFKRWRGEIGGLRPTVFFGASTGFADLLGSARLPQSRDVALRLASSAGMALADDLGEGFAAHFGIDVINGIGSIEMLHIFLSNQPGQAGNRSTAKPVPGYVIELRDDHGLPVSDGETGSMYIQGPSAALMYWGDCAKSRETFQGAWVRSADTYLRNADGSYIRCGRSDET